MRTNIPSLTGMASGFGEEGRPERGFRRAAVLVVLLVLVWIAVSAMPNPVPSGEPPAQAPAETLSETPQLIGPGYLIGLALLAGAGIFALVLRRRERKPGKPTPMREVGRLRTGPQQHLHLIACGGEVLLIGATPTQVTLLKQFPAGLFEEDADEAAPAPQEETGFLHVLERYSGGPRAYTTNKLYPRSSGVS